MSYKKSSHPSPANLRENDLSNKLDHSDLINMAPVSGNPSRPWNPNWYVYQLASNHFLPDSNQKLLNINCGQGVASIRLASLGYQIHGIDTDPCEIDWANEQALQHGLSDACSFEVTDLHHLNTKPNSYDVVAGFDVLSQTNLKTDLDVIQKILKPGGIAILKQHVQDNVPMSESIPSNTITNNAFATIKQTFQNIQIKRFTVLGHLEQLIPANSQTTRSALQKLDHKLLDLCPPLAMFSRNVVLVCYKQAQPETLDIQFAA